MSRYCYWLRYYPTRSETFVYGEVAALQALGHSVRGVAIGAREAGDNLPQWELSYPPSYPAVVRAGARLCRQPKVRAAAQWLSQHQPAKQVAKALWAASTLREGERVHCHFAGEAAEWACMAHQALGTRYGVTVHAVDLFKPRPSLRQVLQQATAVITVTQHNAREILRLCGVRAHVQPCGVDPARWPAAGPQPLGPVVFVGRDVPKKGLEHLLRAMERVPRELVVIGSEQPGLALEGVRYLGACSPAQIREQLRQASLFVLPCVLAPDGDRDGLPVALMEAMCSGLPVVTTDLPGLGELVDQEVGWVVPLGAAGAPPISGLSQSILSALDSPDGLHKRGQAGRERILSKFTLAHQVRGLLRAWEAGVQGDASGREEG